MRLLVCSHTRVSLSQGRGKRFQICRTVVRQKGRREMEMGLDFRARCAECGEKVVTFVISAVIMTS